MGTAMTLSAMMNIAGTGTAVLTEGEHLKLHSDTQVGHWQQVLQQGPVACLRNNNVAKRHRSRVSNQQQHPIDCSPLATTTCLGQLCCAVCKRVGTCTASNFMPHNVSADFRRALWSNPCCRAESPKNPGPINLKFVERFKSDLVDDGKCPDGYPDKACTITE